MTRHRHHDLSRDLQGKNWVEANPRKTRVIVLLACFLLLEGLTRALVWAGLLPYERYPTSWEPQYWAYIDPVVGIWRYPNTQYLQQGECYQALHTTNSDGARDRERRHGSSAARRVVVLGDSFVEGFGFEQHGRFTELLEQRTGIEHLNFGTSGNFGTIQEWLLYKSKVQQYDHSDVFLFIFPDNDFRDNDSDEFPRSHYRPFLRETADGYEVYYPVEFENRHTASRKWSATIKNTLDNNIYLLNVSRWGMRAVKHGWRGSGPTEPGPAYDSYTDRDLDIMLHALEQIVHEMGERRLWLFTIPRGGDFNYALVNGADYKLVHELNAFAERNDGVNYADLLPFFLAHAQEHELEFNDYTLGCNDHWGAVGHRVTADSVYQIVYAPRVEGPVRDRSAATAR